MEFTYNAYVNLIDLLRKHDYTIASYHDYKKVSRSVILRHDIDYDLDKSIRLAQLENSIGVRSTYFVLLTGDFYNLFARANREKLKSIATLGHEIGLHFDETCYKSLDRVEHYILEEKVILEKLIDEPVRVISMHRPSRQMLDMNLHIDGLINSYSSTFFKDIKYLSDSRRRWREPVEEIIANEEYERLQILTHAFWYSENEKGLHDTISDFINRANKERYECMLDNFTDLQGIMTSEEIL